MADTRQEHRAASANRPLTMRRLILFALPLLLTFLMMAGAAPIVSIGIARTHGAEGEKLHLQAFLITFITCLTLYSPMFVARNVAIRTVTDRQALHRFVNFFVACASVSSLVILLVSQVDLIGHAYFGRLLNVSLESEQLARQGMLLFVPLPIIIALRGLGQGSHIHNGRSSYVGVGTMLRLGGMTAFVFGYAIHRDMSGPILGGLTYLTGITIETIYVLFMLRKTPQWREHGEGAQLSYVQYGRYGFPLMGGAICNQLMNPILLYLIYQKCAQPEANAAAFDLIRGIGFVILSMLMTTMPAFVTYATSYRNFRLLVKATAYLTGALTLMAAVIALTPLRGAIFVGLFKIDNEVILRLTYIALYFLMAVPLISVVNLVTQGMHTRGGRTAWVAAGNGAGLALLIAAAWGFDLSRYDGVIVAIIGTAAYNLVAATIQTIGLLGPNFRNVITHASLAEEMSPRRRRGAPAEAPAAGPAVDDSADVAADPATDPATAR